MPDYIPVYADPEEYKRMEFRIPDFIYLEPIVDSYLKRLNLATRKEYDIWRENLEERFKQAESGFLKRLFGQIYFNIIIPKAQEYLTPKKLVWVLTQLDKILPWMPNETFKTVVKTIDSVAEYIYKTMD